MMKNKIITAIAAALSALCTAGAALPLHLIPTPSSIVFDSDGYAIPADTVPHVTIRPGYCPPEGYELRVSHDSISITASTRRGTIWASRTLGQLRRPDGSYPCVTINDAPAFPIRGFMYDDGRNFAGVERIMRYIDLMSEYKLNTFQWHLTDKPGWRIESKAFPRLNDGKFQRPGRDNGCFYTYGDLRRVIAYARERGIEVIPEIDMPGHSDYFVTVFGVPMDSPEGMDILETCIDEFCREIPAESCPFLHLGSDEVHIADPQGFMTRMQHAARRNGRRTMVWSPGLDADSLTVRQIWAVSQNVPDSVSIIDSSMGYLNYFDPMQLPAKIYTHPLCGSASSHDKALGGILCLWNDVRMSDKDAAAPHNGLHAGIMAFSESAWSAPAHTTGAHANTMLPDPESDAMQAFEQFQQSMLRHKKLRYPEEMAHWQPIHATEWEVTLRRDSVCRTLTAYGDALDLEAILASAGTDPDSDVEIILRRTIECDSDTVCRFIFGFEAPARSNRISDGIALPGKWPNFGKISINGKEIEPPVWKEPGAYRYHFNTWARPEEELPYTDEQLYWMREPVPVNLHKGRNEVLISLRRHFRGQRCAVAMIEAVEP